MQILDFLKTFFAFDILRNQIHRTGPIKSQDRVDILDIVYIELAADIHHATGFDLEHRDGVAAIINIKCLTII